MHGGLFQELREAFADGAPFVLCIVVEDQGSSPGKPGQKMLVYPDGTTTGTVGGGVNEERVRQRAMELFSQGGTALLRFTLDNPIEGSEPVCGGAMSVYLELLTDRQKLVIFGGGHIGNALARMAVVARFQVVLVDERPEFAKADLSIDRILCCPYAEAVARAEIDPTTSVVIVTPGHTHDRLVLEQVLRTQAAYIGMVGSARKVAEMKKALVAEGADAGRLSRVFAPIGVNLGSNAPEDIALGILAQIVAFRNGKQLPYVR
jgi:xanthine dehydrogenase accessory factor